MGTTRAVGSYPTGGSPYGALDMAGNVWEWSSSQFMVYPYSSTDGREESTEDARRVVRGGSWYYPPDLMRTANRHGYDPDARFDYLGLRLVVVIP